MDTKTALLMQDIARQCTAFDTLERETRPELRSMFQYDHKDAQRMARKRFESLFLIDVSGNNTSYGNDTA